MSAILDIVLPIFGVMVIGYGAARLGYFGEHAYQVLTRFIFNSTIPTRLRSSMAIGMAAGRLLQRRPLDGQTVVGLNAGFRNAVLIGLPLALAALGEAATLPIFLIIAFHSTILISLGTLLIEISHGSRAGLRKLPLNVAKAMATNPIVVSLIAGLAMAASGLPLPKTSRS